VVLLFERLWQELFALVVFVQVLHGCLAIQLEWDDVLRLQLAGELPAQHRGVAAVRAGGGSGGTVADQLGPAGRAGAAGEAGGFLLAPDGALGPLPGGGVRGFLLVCIKGLHLLDLIGGAAVITDQFARGAVEPQRAGTGRALVIGGFIRHGSFPLMPQRACRIPGRTWAAG